MTQAYGCLEFEGMSLGGSQCFELPQQPLIV